MLRGFSNVFKIGLPTCENFSEKRKEVELYQVAFIKLFLQGVQRVGGEAHIDRYYKTRFHFNCSISIKKSPADVG